MKIPHLRSLISGIIVPEKIPCFGSVTVIVTLASVKLRFTIGQHKQRRKRRLLGQHVVSSGGGVVLRMKLVSSELVPPPRDFYDLFVHLVSALAANGGDNGLMGRASGPEIEAQRGNNLRDGGAAGEAVETVTMVVGREMGVGVGVAVVTEDEVVGGAANRGGVGVTGVANLVTHVLEGECVGGVHVLVADEAEFGGVGSAEE